MSKILGIDYGARRVGVALSDDGHTFAFPKIVLENNDALMQTLADLIVREDVLSCVVGEGDNPAGGANTIERRIMIFAEALKVRTGLPVIAMTEAYSSAEARRALEERVATRKDKTVAVDAAAAAIILQSYLDTRKG
ncbi:MAG: Holliday junction resolvase RuvX [Candidatus Pacebacteria bacterium]|nr:Holliday junction resolvase RuvX [Candidatus Paceibacterota bacterium]